MPAFLQGKVGHHSRLHPYGASPPSLETAYFKRGKAVAEITNPPRPDIRAVPGHRRTVFLYIHAELAVKDDKIELVAQALNQPAHQFLGAALKAAIVEDLTLLTCDFRRGRGEIGSRSGNGNPATERTTM